MKTSFYFVLWICIYPLLDLIHNPFVQNNSFLIAIAIVFGISYLIGKAMPRTIAYEHISQIAPIFEDIYTDNVTSFRRRLSRQTITETIVAIYFLVSTILFGYLTLTNGFSQLIPLVIFGLLAFGSMSRSVTLQKALYRLKANPTPQECLNIAEDTYHLNYTNYYEARKDSTYEAMLPQRPQFFTIFRGASILFACASILLGLLVFMMGATVFVDNSSILTGAFASIQFLYGSMAIIFGIKDLLDSLRP